MDETKIIYSTWFSNIQGTFGLIVIDNGFKKKAYMAKVDGKSIKRDEKYIYEYGAPVPLSALKETISHLEE